MAAFGVGKPGPWVGKVQEDVVEWQLDNPSLSKEDCIEWLRNRGVNHYQNGDDMDRASKRPRRS